MALYVDSAHVHDITTVMQSVPVMGVTTNPTLLLDAYQRGQTVSMQDVIVQLLQQTNGSIFVQPSVQSAEIALQEALAYIQLDPERIIPKIPMSHNGILLARQLQAQGKRLAFTAVTSVSQAYMAAMSGAEFIIPYYNRLRRGGIDPGERIAQMAQAIATSKTRILAASIKSTTEAAEALLSGAHDLTIPPQTLLEMVSDPESESAIERFERDLEKMKNL